MRCKNRPRPLLFFLCGIHEEIGLFLGPFVQIVFPALEFFQHKPRRSQVACSNQFFDL
jgi:hypothetical protein